MKRYVPGGYKEWQRRLLDYPRYYLGYACPHTYKESMSDNSMLVLFLDWLRDRTKVFFQVIWEMLYKNQEFFVYIYIYVAYKPMY